MTTPPSDREPTTSAPPALDEERTLWLTALYEANARMVFATCRRLLRNPEDAADATHEVFLRAAASLHAAPDGKDARAWLTTVARNHCLDLLRRRRRYQSALTTLGAGTPPLESETVVVDRQLAQAVLEQLAVRERQALWASHVEERPVAEIAERLGLTYLAAAQLLSRARRRAALVAAELAAIFAFVRSGVLRRRTVMQNSVQPVAAVLIIPLVATVLISGSSGTRQGFAASASPRAHQQSVLPVVPTIKPNGPTSPPTNVAVRPSVSPVAAAGVIQVASVTKPVAARPAPAPPPTRSSSPAVACPSPTGPPFKWGHVKQCLANKSAGHKNGHGQAGSVTGPGRGRRK